MCLEVKSMFNGAINSVLLNTIVTIKHHDQLLGRSYIKWTKPKLGNLAKILTSRCCAIRRSRSCVSRSSCSSSLCVAHCSRLRVSWKRIYFWWLGHTQINDCWSGLCIFTWNFRCCSRKFSSSSSSMTSSMLCSIVLPTITSKIGWRRFQKKVG